MGIAMKSTLTVPPPTMYAPFSDQYTDKSPCDAFQHTMPQHATPTIVPMTLALSMAFHFLGWWFVPARCGMPALHLRHRLFSPANEGASVFPQTRPDTHPLQTE
jgi:hypothetical protein